MKKKIISVFLAVILGIGAFSVSVPFVASASSSSSFLDLWLNYIDSTPIAQLLKLLNSSGYSMEYKFELLTALRDFCKENNINPNSDDFADFLTFAMLEAPDNSNGDYSNAYGDDWADLHYEVHKYMSPLTSVYQMAWVDVQKWIIDHYNDVNTSLDDNGNVKIPVEDFKEELEKQNNTIAPKNREYKKYSWRDLSTKQENPNSNCFSRFVFKEGTTCVDTSYDEGVYIQMYQYRNGSMYYQPYQYHLYCVKEQISEYPTRYKYIWYIDPTYYETIDGMSLDSFSAVVAEYKDQIASGSNGYGVISNEFKYVSLGMVGAGSPSIQGLSFLVYDTFGVCYDNTSYKKSLWFPEVFGFSDSQFGETVTSFYKEKWAYFLRSNDVTDKYHWDNHTVTSPDGSTYKRLGLLHFFNRSGYWTFNFQDKPITFHDSGTTDGVITCNEGCTCDFGMLISSEPFSTTYQFDTTRLPSNSTVTISGDSVYDYSITDNSTGDSSTIYNYVTNNYSYPENPNANTSGSGSGNGGNVGGNIIVGGQVDVGGKVEIDVNVNGGGNGGTFGNSYDMPDMSPVDSYLDSALNESTGIRKFMEEFFGFLPLDIVMLIGIGIAVAILARLFGR